MWASWWLWKVLQFRMYMCSSTSVWLRHLYTAAATHTQAACWAVFLNLLFSQWSNVCCPSSVCSDLVLPSKTFPRLIYTIATPNVLVLHKQRCHHSSSWSELDSKLTCFNLLMKVIFFLCVILRLCSSINLRRFLDNEGKGYTWYLLLRRSASHLCFQSHVFLHKVDILRPQCLICLKVVK